jgi:hypothetical protein
MLMKKGPARAVLLIAAIQFITYSCNKSQALKESEPETGLNTESSGVKTPGLSSVGVISDWETGNASQWNGMIAKSTVQWAVDSNGLYRGDGGSNTNVLFHDNFARGTTFADIAARF